MLRSTVARATSNGTSNRLASQYQVGLSAMSPLTIPMIFGRGRSMRRRIVSEPQLEHLSWLSSQEAPQFAHWFMRVAPPFSGRFVCACVGQQGTNRHLCLRRWFRRSHGERSRPSYLLLRFTRFLMERAPAMNARMSVRMASLRFE